MILPDGFQFSQSSLQDYQDCKLRFFLRYILHLAWPAAKSEPVLESERFMQLGSDFHQLVYRFLMGVPLNRLDAMVHDAQLQTWWAAFSQAVQEPASLGKIFTPAVTRRPEVSLSAPLEGCRLLGKYDLLVKFPDGKFTIFDWKTSLNRPRRSWLADRLQTKVYPYLLVQAGAKYNQDQPLAPEQVEMVYWFAGFPDQPESFIYNSRQFKEHGELFTRLIRQIKDSQEVDFPKTSNEAQCRYCVYRSYCDRGVQAGQFPQADADLEQVAQELTLDFDQIQELEY